jgi:YjbE family integral membrane protein
MEFLVALFEIIIINLVLSGDNAVVIALASRKLEDSQRKKAIFWGTFGAILLRILLTTVAVWVLKIPFLMLVGGLMLVWISFKLLVDKEDHAEVKAGNNLWQAVQTIIVADLIMSLDNVLAIAGAAEGDLLLLVVGIAIGIPIIVFGSTIILKMMEKYPAILYIGAGVLAWTAGEMIVGDNSINSLLHNIPGIHYVVPIAVTAGVLTVGYQMKKRAAQTVKQGEISNLQ